MGQHLDITWTDYTKKKKYQKVLPQVLPIDEVVEEIGIYLKDNTKFNVYGLAAHFGMGKDRFTKLYINSKDDVISAMISQVISMITNHALINEEEYKRSLRYIVAQAETGKAFIELDDKVLEANANKVIFIPPKKKD